MPTPIKVGLLIQGPLFSNGLAFDRSQRSFDCEQNIRRLVRSSKADFHGVCWATWADLGERRQLEGIVPILPSSDLWIARDLRQSDQLLTNKIRQAFSILCGTSFLRSIGCTHVVAVRSDQSLDLSLLHLTCVRMFTIAPGSSLDERIFVPHCIPTDPSMLADFYMAGESEMIESLFRGYLKSHEFVANVHQDYFFKFLWLLTAPERRADLSTYLPRGITYCSTARAQLIAHGWRTHFRSFPKSLFESLVWREDPLKQPLTPSAEWLPGLNLEYGDDSGICISAEVMASEPWPRRPSPIARFVSRQRSMRAAAHLLNLQEHEPGAR
jgi:hypothetical protein